VRSLRVAVISIRVRCSDTSFWNMENEISPPFAFATTDRTLTKDRALRLITNQFADVNALLSACAPHSATSTSLKLQLAWMNHIGNFCLFSGVACSFDVRQIIDEIANLENKNAPTKTKPAERFTGKPLRDFWHKHFFEARFLARNLSNEVEKNFDLLWHRDFETLWENHATLKNETAVDKLAGLITHVMVLRAFEHRAGQFSESAKSRLTGEWIVFAKNAAGRNCYLTLAIHDEPEDAIATRIYQCAWEFPFVLNILKSNGWHVPDLP
jgi:hypothetical protein